MNKNEANAGWQRILEEFLLDSESVILLFNTAGFNRSPTPPFVVMTGSST
jgi:hypothetical protein